jgi:hypothetical protein
VVIPSGETLASNSAPAHIHYLPRSQWSERMCFFPFYCCLTNSSSVATVVVGQSHTSQSLPAGSFCFCLVPPHPTFLGDQLFWRQAPAPGPASSPAALSLPPNSRANRLLGSLLGQMAVTAATSPVKAHTALLPPSLPTLAEATAAESAGGPLSHSPPVIAALGAVTPAGLSPLPTILGDALLLLRFKESTWASSLPASGAAASLSSSVLLSASMVLSAPNLLPPTSLYARLRPELLRRLPPDAPDPSGYLHSCVIAEFAESLPKVTWAYQLVEKVSACTSTSVRNISWLITAVCLQMHASGINVRHLGAVRRHVTDPRLRRLMLVEMVARAIKVRQFSK